jgi:Leucine-rich repeat (LRR) protein
LEDISILSEMPLLEVASLSGNMIKALGSFAQLQNLQELYLRKNSIADLTEIKHLSQAPHLRVLWLSGNPVGQSDIRYHIWIFIVACNLRLDIGD